MISKSNIKKYSKRFSKKANLKVAKNAITTTSLGKIVINRDFSQKDHEFFSKKINTKVEISDQKSSGRCWIFAFLNVLRLKMIEKYDLEDSFEFSSTYLFFFDKLEKSNYFLQNILRNKKENYNSRIMHHFLSNPISDGGMSNMIINLINKYGLIPKSTMDDTYQSKNSSTLNALINNRLREAAYKLRETNINTNKYIDETLEDIFNILVIFLGEPPTTINWEYYKQSGNSSSNNKNKKSKKNKNSTKKKSKKNSYKIMRSITPLDFYKSKVKINVNDYVCIMSYPLKEYNNIYDINYSNNIENGKKSNLINIEIQTLKEIVKASIDSNDAVWFGADVKKYSSNELGVLDKDAFNFKNTVGFDINLNKPEQIKYGITCPNHAMIFKGYSTDKNNKITKWFIENSWGTTTKKTGHFTMSDKWFDDYVFDIIVLKKHVSNDILKIARKKPIELDIWDPLNNYLNH